MSKTATPAAWNHTVVLLTICILRSGLCVHLWQRQRGLAMLVQLFYKVFNKRRRMYLLLLVHKEVAFLQSLIHPLLDPLNPVIYSFIVCPVQCIPYKTDK